MGRSIWTWLVPYTQYTSGPYEYPVYVDGNAIDFTFPQNTTNSATTTTAENDRSAESLTASTSTMATSKEQNHETFSNP